jgi:multidrug efflux pump subunit AcrA (membrane-fusion protein)
MEATAGPADSTVIMTTGLIGAGGADTLPAHVRGRVRQLFFEEGQFVHRGQLLVKLDTRDYVLAPHEGFLGPRLVSEGQRLGVATPITTLSRRRHLVVAFTLPQQQQASVRAGDSVRVWVASRPSRVETGVVRTLEPSSAALFPVEVDLAPRAPLRLGEQATVQLDAHLGRPAAAPVAVKAVPQR